MNLPDLQPFYNWRFDGQKFPNRAPLSGAANASVVVTGTITPSVTEADIVTGSKTIILTVTNDTWVASGATFDSQRANIIAGLDSAQSELLGWNNVVQATQSVGGVVRTSDTVVTITLDAFLTYDITATETITVTVPSTALTGGAAVIATPTFEVTPTGAVGVQQLLTMMGVGS